jgi:hypothetical protein
VKYGEAYIARKAAMKMVDGEFVAPDLQAHEPQMNRADAARYYNAKLEDIFVDQLDKSIPKHKRIKAVRFLMYGHV